MKGSRCHRKNVASRLSKKSVSSKQQSQNQTYNFHIGEQVAKRKSRAYAFYKPDPDVEFDKDDKPKYIVFYCSICRSVQKQGVSSGDAASTGQLLKYNLQ